MQDLLVAHLPGSLQSPMDSSGGDVCTRVDLHLCCGYQAGQVIEDTILEHLDVVEYAVLYRWVERQREQHRVRMYKIGFGRTIIRTFFSSRGCSGRVAEYVGRITNTWNMHHVPYVGDESELRNHEVAYTA